MALVDSARVCRVKLELTGTWGYERHCNGRVLSFGSFSLFQTLFGSIFCAIYFENIVVKEVSEVRIIHLNLS